MTVRRTDRRQPSALNASVLHKIVLLVSRWLFAELIKESLNGFPGNIYTPIGGGTPPFDVNTPPNCAPSIGSVRTVLVVYSYTA